jgi:hypothetical protein
MTANTTPKPPTREDLPVWLEYVRSTFEVLALIVLVATMIYTARGVAATRAAVEASTAQLREAQYESVYGHELDLWKLAAEHPALAPYIVGGKKPPEVSTKADQTRAAQNAAIYNSLDFYAYIFSQLAPRDESGNVPTYVLKAVDKPAYVTDAQWASWRTWAATIVSGFEGAPGMCEVLNSVANGTHTYEESFRNAVREVTQDCVKG